jgi:hypothetical protein
MEKGYSLLIDSIAVAVFNHICFEGIIGKTTKKL